MLREEAIKKHRAMWNWIAEQIENEECTMGIGILKSKFLELQHDDTIDMKINNSCYLCCYSDSDCRNCPLVWPSDAHDLKCEAGYGLYKQCRMLFYENDWQLQAKLCREIANLPERKMSNEKH